MASPVVVSMWRRVPPRRLCYPRRVDDRQQPAAIDASGTAPAAVLIPAPPDAFLPGLAVAGLAVWTAWLPMETHPWTSLVLAAAVVLAVPGRWCSGDRRGIAALVAVAAWLAISALSGPDAATGLRELALLAVAVAVGWVAAGRPPAPGALLGLALGLAALTLWAAWQAGYGFDRAVGAFDEIPDALRPVAAARLASGRAFASLLLPGHLAAVEVMALAMLWPFLVRPSRWRPAAVAGLGLALAGLVLARSPIGFGLAGVVGLGAALRLRRRSLAWAALGVVLLGIGWVAALRPDVLQLEPVALRVDNWRTALWLAGSSPVSGVGFGGYGLASLSVPLSLRNRPAHAHCLPLEMGAELGLAGWLAAALTGWWLVRVAARSWRPAPGLALAIVAVVGHNLVDFSIFTSGVAIPAAVMVGWAVARPRAAPAPGPGRTVAVALTAVATLVAGLHAVSSSLERRALWLPPADGVALSVRAARLAPWAAEPPAIAAAAALAGGDPDDRREALALLGRSRWLRRGSATVAGLEARLALLDGDPLGAAAAAWRACSQQSPAGDSCRDLDELLRSLAKVGGDQGN